MEKLTLQYDNAVQQIKQAILDSQLPGLKGFSTANIKKMRTFYEQWQILELKSVAGGERFGV